MEIKTLHSIDTQQPADSVEWCTHPDYLQYFICGTYHLEKDDIDFSQPPTRRIGRIYLYKYDIHSNTLDQADVIETAAVLDAKWLVIDDKCLLIAASALADVLVYELRPDERLHFVDRYGLADHTDESRLTLSVDVRAMTDRAFVLASDSRGSVTLLTVAANGIRKDRSWKAHNFEAWTCAFDKWNSNVVYSGGDDTYFHAYDIRTSEAQRTLVNKSHVAGVTSFLSYAEHCLISGSYDESLRIFDTRSLRQPVTDLQLGGGIWRIKPSKCDRNLLLCACMYKNFTLCHINSEKSDLTIVGDFTKHANICYGADWAPGRLSNHSQVMVTCSFYDKLLCISTVHDKN